MTDEERINLRIPECVLITGANVGIGFECSRQLGLIAGVRKIFLACRNAEKGNAAKANLEQLTNKKIFEVVIMDVSNLDSVRRALEKLKEEDVIDGVVLNAGGGGGSLPNKLTEYGVTVNMAVNILGHVLLVNELLLANKIRGEAASVIYAGSESARGIPAMNLDPPKLVSGSVEEFMSICDGTFFSEEDGKNPKLLGGYAKFVGALWMSSLARKHSDIRFLTISPGATTGTEVRSVLPWYQKLFVGILVNFQSLIGKAHSVEVGAKRYVDGLSDHSTYKSGVFYGSKEGLSGEVCDQSVHLDYFSNETFQDNAFEAILKYIK